MTYGTGPKSIARSLAQSKRAREARQREYDELVAARRVVDLKAAMARCFTAGNHSTETLRGGFD